ncbi:hypothetical protein Q3G72_022082 [Acer saccharum]|nr:hypothetical protein Q3G72_022082 [Acer saccharum]
MTAQSLAISVSRGVVFRSLNSQLPSSANLTIISGPHHNTNMLEEVLEVRMEEEVVDKLDDDDDELVEIWGRQGELHTGNNFFFLEIPTAPCQRQDLLRGEYRGKRRIIRRKIRTDG